MRRATQASGHVPLRGTILAVLALALWLGTASAAHAAPLEFYEPMDDVPETGQAGLLGLTSSAYPLDIPWLEPGEAFSWQIGLHLTEQPIAAGTLEFIPYEGLVQQGAGYRLTAQRCETQWTGQSGSGSPMKCASEVTTLLADSPLGAGPTARIPFGSVAASERPHILFTLALPKDSAVTGPFTFALGFTVMGDEAVTPNRLPDTGFAVVGTLSAALLLLGAGVAAKFSRRRVFRP